MYSEYRIPKHGFLSAQISVYPQRCVRACRLCVESARFAPPARLTAMQLASQPRTAQMPTPLATRFAAARATTEALAAPLSAEDCQAQSMPDASPVKWHLAHVTWFFETFILERFEPGFVPHNSQFRVLFNSYYNGVGDKHPRPQRGLLTRPTLAEVMEWRGLVTERVLTLLGKSSSSEVVELVELGIQHEQQHQELILTDLKHLLSSSAVQAVYQTRWPLAPVQPVAMDWVSFEGDLHSVGHAGGAFGARFGFDNEFPRHRVFLEPYVLSNRLVTHGEWAEFVEAGGYREARWWLSAGWDWVNAQRVEAPLYWQRDAASSWQCFTLHGRVPIDPHTPITHISYFEADAYCRWLGEHDARFADARLPTEFEWEAAVAPHESTHIAAGNWVESKALHPMPVRDQCDSGAGLLQAMGDVWQWTSSSYAGYPGFRPWGGAVGEYNGKFMVNQYVLRGGSCATPQSHIRASYRNFFPTEARWQFTGLRLARCA